MAEATPTPPGSGPKSVLGPAGIASASALVASAMLLALPFIERWEGTHLSPYRDMVGVWTVCTGETRVAMRRYSRAECSTMLERAIRSTYGAGVLACVPATEHRPRILAASISLSYNIGVSAYCRSTVARRFNAGEWRAGCDAFLLWNRAGGRIVQGLVNRRESERRLCLEDAK